MPVKLSTTEFFELTKVLRMLYGLQISEHFFLMNLEKFTGITKTDLQKTLVSDNLEETIKHNEGK